VGIQDIDAYAARDQARPKRDARVGMLPPKLAQIIINLANPPAGSAVLDPFCGTGVVLQEALLMGFDAYGTDIDERMIDYSRENLDWLATRQPLDERTYLLETGDATSFEWQDFDAAACETYLGRPFSALPAPDVLEEVMRDVDVIHKKFLKNIAKQTKPGFRMCVAVPAWKTRNGFRHLKTLDSLEEMGYTRQGFVHASNDSLVYHRENQIVARELVTLIRK
jgi:tRNA (guanine10-N2)-dimethyltransferase